jgi:hypothetical protein
MKTNPPDAPNDGQGNLAGDSFRWQRARSEFSVHD